MTQPPSPSPTEAVPSPEITPQRAAGLEGLAPADVDFAPPLVHATRIALHLLGKGVSIDWLMAGMGTSGENRTTPSVAECLRAAGRAGLKSHVAERENIQSISPLTLPCILLLKNDRSCVVTRIQGEMVEAIFPEDCIRGESDYPTPRKLLAQQLNEDYTGYCIFVHLEEQPDTRISPLTPTKERRWFWDVFTHYLPIYKHVALASVLINFLGIASSLFAMNVYDRVVPNSAFDTLWVLAAGVCLAYFFDWLLRNLRGYFVDVAGRNADVVLSSKLVRKILTMRMSVRPESTGALISNIKEFEALREFFSSSSLLVLVDLPFLLLFLWLISFIAGPMVLVPLVAVPLMIISGLIIQRVARREAERSYAQTMQKGALLNEIVNGLETVKSCSAEAHMLRKWELVVDDSAEASSSSRRYATLSTTVSSGISQMVTVAMIVWGVYRISTGELTMGGLIASNILVGRAMAPLMQIASMLNRMQHSRLTMQVLDKLMELPSENDEGLAHVDFGHIQPAYTLEGVTFFYPGSTVAGLKEVSLHIAPGERVAIIGRMGTGKSTLGKLLMGFYAPSEGAVRFGGVDLRQIDPSDLRSRLGVLPQDVVLFHDTIRNNIALGMPSVSDKLIMRAAYLSGALEFIQSNPAGFGGRVGERGMNLSGGQRQSIALARALLLDPDVLVLDEPTSNMDNATESVIKQRLGKVLTGKTLILITHRLSLLDLVDRLIVVEGGKIMADGPKQDVLRLLSHTPPPVRDPSEGASHA